MASSKTAKQVLEPWVSGLYATPTVALAPLFILWFGIGIVSKIIVVALLVIFPVVINTETGLRTTNPNLIETVRAFGANRRQIFFKVSLPSALPFIFAGFKLGIGQGGYGNAADDGNRDASVGAYPILAVQVGKSLKFD